MIGGIVTRTKVLADRVYVDCEEKNSTSKCAIYVERNDLSERIKPADNIWWQGRFAMWTPYGTKTKGGKTGKDYDIKIRRIGYSGAREP